MNRNQRLKVFRSQVRERILVVDGAMGTSIQAKNLGPQDFGGAEFEGCNEYLSKTAPRIIESIHDSYFEAGADIAETNTFGGTPLVLGEFNLSNSAREINILSAQLARKSADKFSKGENLKFVAGSMGPTTKAISVTGGITFDELIDNFYAQAEALHEGGVDYLLLETCQDTRNTKAALIAIDKLNKKLSADDKLPVAVTVTIEPMGTMLAGQSIEALYTSISHVNLLYIGLNCATGPQFMTDHIRSLSQISRFPIACLPNAGLPDSDGNYIETPEMVARVLKKFGEAGWINIVGGCCGTTPGHIKALADLAKTVKPREPVSKKITVVSGIDNFEITDEVRPVLVGERTNIIGSKKFKDLVIQEKFEEAAEIARAQVRQGAQIIDICFANPDRDEISDIEKFLGHVTKMVRVPLMIDSTDEKVFEKALTYCQGKAILNSINLEDGEERFEKVVPIAKKYGAALVVGTIDEDPLQGMGVTRERKLEIARRSYDLLVQKYGINPEDIIWDPLVFPCATGDKQYLGSAIETVEAIKMLKSEFPATKTILGVSNVSFGLPAAGREVMNSVYLYHCTQAGLDLAIVNSEKLYRYAQIPEEEKRLAEEVLFKTTDQVIADFTALFRTRKSKELLDADTKNLTLEERLAKYIVEGTKDGLVEDLNTALSKYKPLDIINGPLMKGMDEVGRLFNSNQLIVAEVLQSAEAMKAAVNHLEPLMEKDASSVRGKVVLATVKGDVHDIGKNLVDIILSNNGFKVINLGIKILPETLIQAVREHSPDIIGLSGLLVKSAQQMVLTAQDLKDAHISVPILVGGAALTDTFTYSKIGPAYEGTVAYARDAMTGLDLAKRIMDPLRFDELKDEIQSKGKKKLGEAPKPNFAAAEARSPAINTVNDVPQPPDFNKHYIKDVPLDPLWKFINPRMLFGRHLGIKGSIVRLIEQGDWKTLETTPEGRKATELYQVVEDLKAQCRNNKLKPQAVYQFFEAASDGNKLFIYPTGTSKKLALEPAQNRQSIIPLSTFKFPRQGKLNGLCLADFVNPIGFPAGDNICMFVVSAGQGIRDWSTELKEQGQYLKSHALQALAIETAEAFAEYLHSQIRNMWGFADASNMTMMERFQARYRGKRFSFGYPACPVLDDQAQLFTLLKPESIGVALTDGFMMEPEASVSAIVFHHPGAVYFGIGEQDV